MRISRCVKADHGHLGCALDATRSTQELCSELSSCVFTVAQLRDELKPCPDDFVYYLNVTYSCTTVENSANCTSRTSLVNTTATRGYLSSYHAQNSLAGRFTCPLNIIAHPGQRIDISAYRRGRVGPDQDPLHGILHGRDKCRQHVVIKDNSYIQNLALCDLSWTTKKFYTSLSSHIRVHFDGQYSESEQYVLEYKVVGCADIVPIGRGRFERQKDDSGVVYCDHLREVWHLTCDQVKWIGQFGNCSEPVVPNYEEKTGYSMGLTVAVIVGLIMGVIVGIFMLFGILFCRRRHRSSNTAFNNKPSNLTSDNTANDSQDVATYGYRFVQTCGAPGCDGWCQRSATYSTKEQLYAHNYYHPPAPCPLHSIYSDRTLSTASRVRAAASPRTESAELTTADVTIPATLSSFKPLSPVHAPAPPEGRFRRLGSQADGGDGDGSAATRNTSAVDSIRRGVSTQPDLVKGNLTGTGSQGFKRPTFRQEQMDLTARTGPDLKIKEAADDTLA